MSEKSEVLGIGSRIHHPAYGDGVIIRIHSAAYEVCFIHHGIKNVGKEYSAWEITDRVDSGDKVSFDEYEKSLIKILRHWSDITEMVQLGDKWTDGMLVLKPGDADLKEKEIPIETFFHKIVMVRDRLRVMEQ